MSTFAQIGTSGVYKLSPDPTGPAGLKLNQNFVALVAADAANAARPATYLAADAGAQAALLAVMRENDLVIRTDTRETYVLDDAVLGTFTLAVAGGANPFDQDLNSTDSPVFATVYAASYQGDGTALSGVATDTELTAGLSGKADKTVPAAAGNFAALDAGGNLIDSTRKHADYATASAVTTHAALTGTSAHGAATTNTANAIVCRAANGGFFAGPITCGASSFSSVTANNLATASATTGRVIVADPAADGLLSSSSTFTWTSAGGLVVGALNMTNLKASATGVGFYGTAAAAKPTVTGSRGANAALASLLTALAGLGLITDSSS